MTTGQVGALFLIAIPLAVLAVLAYFGLAGLLDQFETSRHHADPQTDAYLDYLEAEREVADLAAAGRDAVLDRLLRDRQ